MIEHLSLVNFKAFRSARIRLAPVTLLTGLNSSGKSTVLQSLALLRQSYDSGILMSTDGDADSHGSFLLDGDLVELGTGQDLLHEDFSTQEPGEGPFISVMLETADTGILAWAAKYAPEQDVLPIVLPNRPEDQIQPKDWENLPLFSRRFQYLKADRITPATTYPRSHHQAIGRGFLGARGEHAVNFLRHHAQDVVPDGHPLRHPKAGGHTLLDQVVAWMQELCPGVNLEASEIPGIDSVRLSFGFGGTAGLDSTRRRRPTNVGFGLTYALPIVVACLTAGPGSLILLENPEAHLHPRGQSRMASLIAAAASAGAQLVVETHSDHVLDGTRLAVKQGRLAAADTAVHFFRGNGAGVEIVTPTVAEDGSLSEWPEGFFDESDHTLDQLLG